MDAATLVCGGKGWGDEGTAPAPIHSANLGLGLQWAPSSNLPTGLVGPTCSPDWHHLLYSGQVAKAGAPLTKGEDRKGCGTSAGLPWADFLAPPPGPGS